MLSPIWKELADKVKSEYKGDDVLVAKVGAEAHSKETFRLLIIFKGC